MTVEPIPPRLVRLSFLLLSFFLLVRPAPAAAQGPSSARDPAPSSFARSVAPSPGFMERQLAYRRVREAMAARRGPLIAAFRERGIPYPPAGVFLRVFKREREVEVWVRPTGSDRFTLFRRYPMCVLSGEMGPKRRRGDYQVPEGFYHISYFNPTSEYHLSLGIDYPNRADLVRSGGAPTGGDIFIHGGCKTIGCVPMTDAQIEEIYWLAVEARAAGQRSIPVDIFPTRLDRRGMEWLRREYPDPALRAFWTNLRNGYLAFETTHRLPATAVDGAGRYVYGAAAERILAARSDEPPLVGAAVAAGAIPVTDDAAGPVAAAAASASKTIRVNGRLLRARVSPPPLIGKPVEPADTTAGGGAGSHGGGVG